MPPAIVGITGDMVAADVMIIGFDPNDIPGGAPAMIVPVGMIGASGGGFESFESVSPGIRRIRSIFDVLAAGASTVGVFLLECTSRRCCNSLEIVQFSTITICD